MSQICLVYSEFSYYEWFCSSNVTNVLVADSIYADNWNYHSAGETGNIGLGFNSPIWQIFGNPSVKQFDILLSCSGLGVVSVESILHYWCKEGSFLTLNGFNPDV
jgi:hypothetical protein